MNQDKFIGTLSQDVFCYQILPYLPYFYLSIFKRVNRNFRKFVEGYQKYLLFRRFIPLEQKSKGRKNLMISSEEPPMCRFDDLKLVEKNDFDKFKLIRTQNNVSLMANMIKKLYYYKELKWFLYYLDGFENTKVEWTDRLYINGCDFDELITHGEDNFYEMNEYEMVEGDYTILLALVGVTIDDENYFKHLQNEIGTIRFSYFELVFSNVDVNMLPYHIRDAFFTTDCSRACERIKSFKTSKAEALKYVKLCAKMCGVVPSLVPRGDLFCKLIYRNNSLDWKLCEWMYRNTVIPLFEELQFLYRYNIMCYCFDQIMSMAKHYYLEEMSFTGFLNKYSTFKDQPKVREWVNRLKELFSIVVEKGLEEEIFNPTQHKNILQMAQTLDKKSISKLSYLMSLSGVMVDKEEIYSWENHFICGFFQREPTNVISLQLQPVKTTNSQLVELNMYDLYETDSSKIKY